MSPPNEASGADERSPLLAEDTGGSSVSLVSSRTAQEASSGTGSNTAANSSASNNVTPPDQGVPKASTDMSWGMPEGLPIPAADSDSLNIFRRALGINTTANISKSSIPSTGVDPTGTIEQGRKAASGIYREVIRQQSTRHLQYVALTILVYFSHIAQIIIGASLTALGPQASDHSTVITVLGAANTILAGVLALINGQGLPARLRRDEVEFRKLQDWIEETERLLAVGVLGKDRAEAGLLVEVAFKKYNAVKASEENNKPENYVAQTPEATPGADAVLGAPDEGANRNSVVRLNR